MSDSNQAPNSRAALVQAALETFAEKGFEGASTREIAERAHTNISSIRYYFGDKAGLYRAAYTEPLSGTEIAPPPDALLAVPLPQALQLLYRVFLEPLKHGETFRLVMKLHFREMIEPTGAWEQEIDSEIKPHHMAMVKLLMQQFELSKPDLDAHRMAFALMGMAVQFYVAQDVVEAICPSILKTKRSIDTLADRLATYAVAMVQAEAVRRKTSPLSHFSSKDTA